MSLFLPVICGLNNAQVSYVVVGGLAVVLHGHTRITGDIDIVLRLEEENVARGLAVVLGLGYLPRAPVNALDLANEQVRETWVKEKGLVVLSFYNPDNPVISIDFFAKYPMDYGRLLANSVVKRLGQIDIRVCSIGDLIEMKRACQRPRDFEDIAALEILQRRAKKIPA